MNSPLSLYLSFVLTSIRNEDASNFRNCITINPGVNEGSLRSSFPEPSEFDLYPLPEKFRPIVKNYLKLMKSIYILNDIDSSLNDLNEMVNNLNRAADTQTNWINPALINASTELINVYQVKQKSNPDVEQQQEDDGTTASTSTSSSSLEKLATTINNSFKLSLNDKNLDLKQSKRTDIYFFLGNLIKIYFKLGKLELAKSVEKALKGTRFDLPPLDNPIPSKKKHSVTYLYYSAMLSLDDSNFVDTESKLVTAMNLLSYYKEPKFITKHMEMILMILIPLRLYNNSLLPTQLTWEKFPNLKFVYKDCLFKAIIKGDLKSFEKCQSRFQILFLKRHLYLLVENLKSLCYLQLVKKVAKIFSQLSEDKTSTHIVPLSAFQVGLEVSTNWKRDQNNSYVAIDPSQPYSQHLDEIECILANLIFEGKIKGYISHGNKCIVLSKTNAFPTQVVRL